MSNINMGLMMSQVADLARLCGLFVCVGNDRDQDQ